MISRIYGLTLRYLFVYKRSFIRFGELLVFPLLDLLLWGFFASYIKQHAPVGYLLGALILWDVFYRANQAASLSILQEMWVGNTINLFVTPIRSIEIIISTSLFGIIRASIIFIFLSFCAYYLYSFNFFSYPINGALHIINVFLFAWALGLVTASLILLFGEAAESLAWFIPLVVQPFCAVFYPLDSLPLYVKYFSMIFPITHDFESLRGIMAGQEMNYLFFYRSVCLNIIWLILSGLFFVSCLKLVRERGYLTRGARS